MNKIITRLLGIFGSITMCGLLFCAAGANAEDTDNAPAGLAQVDEDQTADADSARNSQPAEELTARVDKAASEAVSVVVDVLEGLEKEKDEVFDRAAITSFAEEFVDIACEPYVNYLHGLDDPTERHIEWVERSIANSVPLALLSSKRSGRPGENWQSKEKAREWGRLFADRADRNLQHIRKNNIDPRLIEKSFAPLFDLQERAFRRIMEHLHGKRVVVKASFPPPAHAGITRDFVNELETLKESILSDLSFESKRTIPLEKALYSFATYGEPSAQDSMPIIAGPDLYPLVDVESMTMEQQNELLDRHVEDFIAGRTRQDGSIDLITMGGVFYTAVEFHIGIRNSFFQIPDALRNNWSTASIGLEEREFTFISPFPPDDSDQ